MINVDPKGAVVKPGTSLIQLDGGINCLALSPYWCSLKTQTHFPKGINTPSAIGVTLTAGVISPGLNLSKSCKLSQSSIIGSDLRPALTSHLDSLTCRNTAWLKKGEGRDYCCGSHSCPRLVGRHRSPTPPGPSSENFYSLSRRSGHMFKTWGTEWRNKISLVHWQTCNTWRAAVETQSFLASLIIFNYTIWPLRTLLARNE